MGGWWMTATRQGKENVVHLNSMALNGGRDFAYGWVADVQEEGWRTLPLPHGHRFR